MLVFPFRAKGRLYVVFSPAGFVSKKGYEKDLYVSSSNSRIRLSFKGSRSELYQEFV